MIIRPPLVYGPGVGANFKMIYDLCATGIPLPFGCLSNNKRSFIFIFNLVDFVDKCLCDERAADQVFQVSDDCDLSTAELVTEIRRTLGMPPRLINLKPKILTFMAKLLRKEKELATLSTSMQVDIAHAKSRLSWEPPFSTSQGLLICTKNE